MKKQRNVLNERSRKIVTSMKPFLAPDFRNSIAAVSAALAEFLGAPNQNAALPILKEKRSKGYQNIVFFCFDGLGRRFL